MQVASGAQKKPAEQTHRLLRWMTWLTAAGLLAMAWFLAASPIKHDDLFWHLQSGEWMVAQGRIQHEDVFSYTRTKAPWITHEWLFSLLCYLFYRVGGTQGLIVLKQLLVVSIFSVLIVTTRRTIDSLRQAWLWPILCLALCAFVPFLILRAALVTSLCLALLWWALQRDPALQRKSTWGIVAGLFLVWGNLHAGVIFGFALIGGLWIEAFWRGWRYAEKQSLRRVTIFLVMCLAVSLINPNGIHVWLYPWYLNRFFYHSGISFDLGIFAAPTPIEHPFFFLFLALCLVALWPTRQTFRRIRMYEAFASVLFLILALRSNRFIDHFVLLSLPWCVRLLLCTEEHERAFLTQERDQKNKHPHESAQTSDAPENGIAPTHPQTDTTPNPPGHTDTGTEVNPRHLPHDDISRASALLASLSALAVIALAWLLWQPAMFVREPLSRFPLHAAEFLQKHRIQGRFFHHQNEGGFYGWKLKQPIFWDGRNLLFSPLVQEFIHVKDFSDVLKRYDVEILLLNYSLFQQMKPWLKRHRKWVLVYWDDQSAVYVLDSPKYAEWTKKHRYHFLRPFGDMPRLHDWANVQKRIPLIRTELARAVRMQPNAQLPRYLQGLFALYTNDLPLALRALQQAAGIRPKKQVYLSLSYTLQRLQRFDEARLWLQRAQHLR